MYFNKKQVVSEVKEKRCNLWIQIVSKRVILMTDIALSMLLVPVAVRQFENNYYLKGRRPRFV